MSASRSVQWRRTSAGGQLIAKVMDLGQENMVIAHGICKELDDIKSIYSQLPDLLTKVLGKNVSGLLKCHDAVQVVERELQRIPRCLRRSVQHHLWSIVYVPQVGYLIQVLGAPLGAELLDAFDDYEQAFESTADDGSLICYYTGQCTERLNDRFGDILHQIQDMENSLCAELIYRAMEYKASLIRGASVCAELDALTALAHAAREGNYCRPIVTESQDIIIQQGISDDHRSMYLCPGRHPLTEMVVDTFIPNDTILTETEGHIQVITGPNASGKSSYMKQVALIVFLSHIGSFVPARECSVGLTDRIFSRVCSSQTAKTSRIHQSSFMADLNRMRAMIRHATPRSLLLIDEFGKGTLTSDGVGLLCSMLEHWSVQHPSPSVIVCTHFSEIFESESMKVCRGIQFRTMDVITDVHGSDVDACHVILYKLIPGRASTSYGIDCARMCGMPEDVIYRAQEILEARLNGRNLTKQSTDRTQNRDRLCEALIDRLHRMEVDRLSIDDLLGWMEEMRDGWQ